MNQNDNIIRLSFNPQEPETVATAALNALAVLNAFESLMNRFNFERLALSEIDFANEVAATNARLCEYVEEFGLVSEFRQRLRDMGWQPPEHQAQV